jgi:glycosyltransferase involved in cell wall biosynthesis
MINKKHVLVIPRGHLMTKFSPLAGIFEFHQAKTLSNAGYKVGIISIGSIPLSAFLMSHSYSKIEEVDNILILRSYKRYFIPFRFSSYKTLKKKYIKLFINQLLIYIKLNGLPEIIHSHNFLFSGIIAKEINKLFGIPYIVTEHSSSYALGSFSKYIRNEIIDCSNNSKFNLAVSTSFVDLLNSQFGIKSLVFPNIIDEDFLLDDYSKKSINQIFVFLNVASLDKNKNHELLIRAFAKKFQGSKAVLKIIGEGYLLLQLKKLCKDLKVYDQVFFLGLLERKQVKYEMQNAKSFVLSSNYETFGVVLIEALSLGIPVISTNCGGPYDIVNNDNGILVKTNNIDELSNAMGYLFNNENLFDSKNIKLNAIKKYGKDKFLNEIEKLYS